MQDVSSSLLSTGRDGRLEEELFVEEEFLHKKINYKDVYVDYSAMANTPENAVKQYGYLTALK